MSLIRRFDMRAAPARMVSVCLFGLSVASYCAPDVAAQTAPAPKQKSAVKAKPAQPGEAPVGDDARPVAAAKRKDPAEAQRTLDSGIKLLQAGKAEQAIQTFSSAITGGGLPPTLMARALYQRGLAYRKAAKPALAIGDLTSALWLKGGLQDADRADAVQQRAQAYREAGLPDQTDDEGRPAGAARMNRAASLPQAASGGRSTAAPVATASLAPDSAPTQPAPSSGGGFFANLFGGGSKAEAVPPSPPTQRTPAQPVTSGWSSDVASTPKAKPETGVRTASAAAAVPATVTPAPAATTLVKAGPDGKFHARIALVRSQAEADGVVTRLKTQYGGAIGARQPDISQAQFGGMGVFFQVRVGPFANAAEAQSLCGKLKSSGLDCVPVDR
jgi:tetratricopeptide (TPR) repeat protein